MRRRTWIALTVVMATSFATTAGMAVAAGTKSAAKLTCHEELIAAAPEGNNVVDQPPTQGSQYGPANCRPFGAAGFGSGIVATKFNVPDSGDTVGKYTQYFGAGTVKGTFDLTPEESNFSSTTFTAQSWQGTVKVLRGTGVYQGIKGKKVGTMKCTSVDSVHLKCVEKVTLKTL